MRYSVIHINLFRQLINQSTPAQMSKKKDLKKRFWNQHRNQQSTIKIRESKKKDFLPFSGINMEIWRKKFEKYTIFSGFCLIFAHFESFFLKIFFSESTINIGWKQKKRICHQHTKNLFFFFGNQSTGPRFARPKKKRKRLIWIQLYCFGWKNEEF